MRGHAARWVVCRALANILALTAWISTQAAEPAAYLSLPGIPGDSTDASHPDWIAITTLETAITGVGRTRVLDLRRGPESLSLPPQFSNLVCRKAVDCASPRLAVACAEGVRFEVAHLDSRASLPNGAARLQIELRNVGIRDLELSAGPATPDPVEKLALDFLEILSTYLVYDFPSQQPLAHEFRWDLGANSGEYRQYAPGEDPLDAARRLLDHNLVGNPGAEAGPAAETPETGVPPPEWETAEGLAVFRYGAWDGLPTLDSPGPIDRGLNLFAGGLGLGESTARQTVEIAPAAPLIDPGHVRAVLSAWLGGSGATEDVPFVDAVFLGDDDLATGEVSLPPVTSAERQQLTSLVFREAETQLPPGTRRVRIVLRMIRLSGDPNGAVADNLSLVLTEEGAGPDRLPVRLRTIAGERPGSVVGIQLVIPAGIEGLVLESTSVLGHAWQPEELPSFLENGERVFDLPISPDLPHRFWRVRQRP